LCRLSRPSAQILVEGLARYFGRLRRRMVFGDVLLALVVGVAGYSRWKGEKP